ncbi:MAG: M48 family metalloprotease [Microscillaceae bacterium]
MQAQLFGNFNLFSIQDDVQLGKQVEAEIAKNTQEYPILDEARYPVAYRELRRIRDEILNSGMVKYRNDFEWKLYIIHDDKTLNAFVTPGGYIYVYTGLIKYLDNEDQLAGVMGHEIGHADQRHSTRNMTKQYGVSFVLGMILGRNPGQLGQIAGALSGNLAGLKFSRDMEEEADAYSVKYLARTRYQCNGAAGFFEKILSEGSGKEPPQFLSTHPSSQNRVRDINQRAQEEGCSTKPGGQPYEVLKNSLP